MHIRSLVAVAAISLALGGVTSAAAEARFSARFEWSMDAEGFGGFSGIEVSEDGARFIAITDDGMIAQAALDRTPDGLLSGVSDVTLTPLLNTKGAPLGRYLTDAEGLAQSADGRLFISFEGEHRVLSYPAPGTTAKPLPIPDGFAAFQRNSAMEALASGPGGALYTMPERSGAWTRPFPVWRFEDGTWTQPHRIPRRDKLLPVGADFGPDGRFYLLERELVGIFGFRTRVRSFALGPKGFGDERTELTTQVADFDNLEGLSVWQDDAGQIRLTMISDDNFNAFQTTEIVEFVLTE
ncbi:esterase-like activity of phytase family protein [Anianabacter salinae]|uniref:esterase-like activity of phytase family protein n=1 Tax=Anianabacter salinae TaxID=2851023 RepID=UPI00225E1D05|nr:esterase-like activity of phytase family protein [Anianabacter salinae]MBV0913414.1 esterase-like activity of phytase family protein [Anianabacter salinae]